MALAATLALTFAVVAPAAAGPRGPLVCRGHEPEWSLRIDDARATLATLGPDGLVQTGLEGRLHEVSWAKPAFLVYRGRPDGSGGDLVAVITRESCADTMAEASEAGGVSDWTARVSLPDGATRLGCCAAPTAPVPRPAPVPAPPPAPAPASADVAPVRADGGRITGLALPDGGECRPSGRGVPATYRGLPVRFDCGRSGGDTVGLVGTLAVGPGGLLSAQRALIEWREGGHAAPPIETTVVRVTEITLSDGLVCRFAGKGSTLAFDGRRASYTCGMKDGATVALLGDLEPVEGGLRILRARVVEGENGFTLRSSEPILVAAPR
jgi:uncharacterized membrane protein